MKIAAQDGPLSGENDVESESAICAENSYHRHAAAATEAGVPIGGTTGICHSPSASVDQAVESYRSHRLELERPIIPGLRRRFGLTAVEAVAVIQEAAQAGKVDGQKRNIDPGGAR